MDQWLRNTNVVKVIALIIGILLWAVVRSSDTSTIAGSSSSGIVEENIGNVVVTPKYDQDKFFVELIEPSKVTVSLSGRDSAVKKVLNAGNYSVELDLTQVAKGEYLLPVQPVGFPANVSAQISPANVKVIVDEKKNKSMPVTVNVTGIPGVGWKAGQPVTKPMQVTVSVPSRIYDEVESVRADISVEKATAAVVDQRPLVAYDKNGKAIESAIISPAVVDVEVPITSPFTLVPLQLKLVGEPPAGFAVSAIRQSIDKVTVYGAQDVLDRLEYYEGPQVPLNDLKEDREFTLPIPLKGNIKQLDPDKVVVNVTVVPSVQKTLEAIPLSIIGQNEGFNTKVVTPEAGKLTLQAEGAPAVMEKLKAQDVQAIVDVSNLPPGRHELPVKWNLPTFVKQGMPQAVKATIEISAKSVTVPGNGVAPAPVAVPEGPPAPATGEQPAAVSPDEAAAEKEAPAAGGAEETAPQTAPS